MSSNLSYSDSAQKVLEEFSGGEPMHYGEITEKAIEIGCLVPRGKTPNDSMHATISEEIKRSELRGERPRFTKHGKGFFGLSKWVPRGIEGEIEKHNRKVREDLRKKLLQMKWEEFEKLVEELFIKMDFEETEVTSKGKDKGIDVRGILRIGNVIEIQMAIQVKRWKHNVQAPVVREVRGSLDPHERGLIVTTSDFSKGAKEEARKGGRQPVALMNGKDLVALMVEHEVGVTRSSHDLLSGIVELKGEAMLEFLASATLSTVKPST